MTEITAGARFDQWIDRHRKKKYDVAEQVGVTPEALSRWLSGKGRPNPTARIAIEFYTQSIDCADYLPRDIWGEVMEDLSFEQVLKNTAKAARNNALREAAKIADKWADENQRGFGNGGPAAEILALIANDTAEGK